MIPILFDAKATAFRSFGIGALSEATSCLVTEERNGVYELTLKYPTRGKLFNEIINDRIILAKPNETSSNQAFRIYRITVPIDGEITIYAQHISYDLSGIGVMPFSLSNVTANKLMNYILANPTISSNFVFYSETMSVKDVKVEVPCSIRSLLGSDAMSILALWGGEFEWDNFLIRHKVNRGSDNGVIIEYGKNLTKLEHDSETTSIYSDLLPYAYNTDSSGVKTIVLLKEKILPVPTTLENRKNYIMDFTSYFESGTIITENLLRERAKKYIEENPFGVEIPSVTVSFEALWKMSEYSKLLERISLCDVVTIRHSKFGITTKVKVIKTIYDCLTEKYQTITLGTAKSNFINRVNKIQEATIQNILNVETLPSMVESAIIEALMVVTGNTGGYIVLRCNEKTYEPYEFLILDKPKLDDAKNVWKWDVSGLSFSSTGYKGTYKTAIRSDGSIVASFITSGLLKASQIDCEDVIKASKTYIETLISNQLVSGSETFKGKVLATSGTFEGDLDIKGVNPSKINKLQTNELTNVKTITTKTFVIGNSTFEEITDGVNLSNNFVPSKDDSYSLGSDTYRWKNLYVINPPTILSDKRKKTEINYDISEYSDLFDLLKPVSYKLKNDTDIHFGFIAQDVESSMKVVGLNPNKISLLQHSKDSYGLRYNELHALEINEIKKLKNELKDIKSQLEIIRRKLE